MCSYSSYRHLKARRFSGWKPSLLLHFDRIYGRIMSNCINFHKTHIWYLRLGPTIWTCSKNILQWNKLASLIQKLNTLTWATRDSFPPQELFVQLKRKAEFNVWLLLTLLMISILLDHEFMLNRLTRKLFVFFFSIENVNLACVRLLYTMDLTNAITSSH